VSLTDFTLACPLLDESLHVTMAYVFTRL
jgi:hypothetical protein